MGDMVQQAVTQQDYSVTAGILAVSVLTLITVALS
jgi:ABC-type dipeptide/oligopeptide/nickel transport system permease component